MVGTPMASSPSKKPGKRQAPLRKGMDVTAVDVSKPENDEISERIAKRIARAGVCSRREAERMIADGKVRLNGKLLTTPAITVGPSDRIEINDEPLPMAERTRLWLLHKKSGTVTTARDPEGRKTVFELLPDDMPRVLSVGRLDINTEGLILLTNDGGLARELELPSTGWLRRYRVRAHGSVEQARLDALKDGIAVDGVLYGSIEAEIEREQGSNVWITFAMREGKNREVKKVLGALGLEVNRLIRVSYGPFQLGDLAGGAVQEVRGRTLRDQLGSALIKRAGANFDGPLLTPSENVGKKPSKAADTKTKSGAKRKTKPVDPLSRLSTSNPNEKKRRGAKNGASINARNKKGATGADRRR